MSLRSAARQLGISPAYLSYMVNGKRPWRADLKDAYERLVNSPVNRLGESVNSHERRPGVHDGAGDGIRTHDILLGKQVLYP